MFAPMVNPYDPIMTKEERRRTWNKWTRKRKFMYFLARRFPRLLAFFYQRSFLSGKHGQIDRWLSLSLGRRVREALLISFCLLSQHVHLWLLAFYIAIGVHFMSVTYILVRWIKH